MIKNKKVIITGVTGQMGAYFAEFLVKQGYFVIGAARRISSPNHSNIKDLIGLENFILEPLDLGDSHSIEALVIKYQPDYFINCAANSFVGSSWDYPEQHFEFNTLGVLRQLEAIKKHSRHTRYVNFGSSEEFGNVQYSPQDEKHPPMSRSPYAASKVAARQIVKVYRESYNLYAIQCWCFNYESEKRSEEFVTRKITKGISRIARAIIKGESFEPIKLGNIDAKRDWSHAEDFVDGVWRQLNQDEYRADLVQMIESKKGTGAHLLPRDIMPFWGPDLIKGIKEYVLSSGETHTVREFIEKALSYASIPYAIVGYKESEKFIIQNQKNNPNIKSETLVEVDRRMFRPAEVELLLGNSDLARKELDWQPKVHFDTLVKRMVSSDLSNRI